MATIPGNDSVPVQLLHEGEGHIVTIELKNGEIYRGLLAEAESTMNCQLKQVTMTARYCHYSLH